MAHSNLNTVTLTEISRLCKRESNRFFNKVTYDPRYCFELFRRAIEDRDEKAWEFIYDQYHPLVNRWVLNCPAFPLTDEEADYFINRAFERFWVAVTPDKLSKFPDLRSLLRYLQTCVFSIVTDYSRHKEHATQSRTVKLDERSTKTNLPFHTEDIVLHNAQRKQLWQMFEERFRNEKERLAIYGTFVLSLKPRQVQAEFPKTFHNAQEVSRIKENFITRLRRDQALLAAIKDT